MIFANVLSDYVGSEKQMSNSNNGNGASSTSGADESPEQAAESDAVSGQRRKLVKATAAAVPAIMTLRSGAAMAVTSMTTCPTENALQAALEQPPGEMPVPSLDPDDWVRVRGRKVTHGNDTYYCVETNRVWECFDVNGIQVANPGIVAVATNPAANYEEVDLLAYIRFDGVQTQYTHYPRVALVSDQAAGPMKGSCLCSVDPDFPMCH